MITLYLAICYNSAVVDLLELRVDSTSQATRRHQKGDSSVTLDDMELRGWLSEVANHYVLVSLR